MPDEHPLLLRIFGPEGTGEVPAEVLAQTIEGLQSLVWNFAYKSEGQSIRKRLKFSQSLKDRFTLRFYPPTQGSFAIGARVSPAEPDLVAPKQIENVLTEVFDFSKAVLARDSKRILALLPDRALRLRTLDCFRGFAPSPGSGFRFELSNGSLGPIHFDETARSRTEKLLAEDGEEDSEESAHQVITGRLQQVNFERREMDILITPARRAIHCSYDESVEPLLFENRREHIQVRGFVTLGEDGFPKSITDVDYIGDLDLSPFVISTVAFGEVILKFHKALVLNPVLDESEQLIVLEHSDLGIHVFAHTRSDLYDELVEHLGVLWDEYVREDPAALDAKALELRDRLTTWIEEVPHA
jgi:hypothetical protein